MTNPKPALLWRVLQRLRADPSLLDDVRSMIERVAKTLNEIDLDALDDADRAEWIAQAQAVMQFADLFDLVDEPEAASVRRMLSDLLPPTEREH